MTVATTTNKITYDGNASSTVWSFTFPGVSAADIDVYYTDADGTISLLSTSTYTLLLNAAIPPNPTGIGGSVTYPLVGSPIAVGTKLTIVRQLDDTQDTSLAEQGVLYPKVIEQALDYLTMVDQQITERLGRQLTVPISDPDPAALPTVDERASMLAGFDADGNMIAVEITDAGVVLVSSAMIPVVEAATLALARTALGLGDMSVEDIGAGLEDDGAGAARVNSDTVEDSSNQSVTSAFHQTQRIATGPFIYTLPRANTLWNGFCFYVFCQTGLITFAINANDAFGNGSAGVSMVVQPGTWLRLTTDADTTGVWYVDSHLVGPAVSAGAVMLNGCLTEAHATNAVTFAVKTLAGLDPSTQDPIFFIFRSVTPGTGAFLLRVVTAALNLTVPSGATLGFTSAEASRVWLAAIDNAGTVELAVVNARNGKNIYPLQGWGIVSTTVMSTSSDSAAVPYSASARSSVPYLTLGYFTWESGLTTAGTWDASPTRIQLSGYGVPLPGETVQVQRNFDGAVATGTTTFAVSDTIPTSSYGDQYMSQSITPTSNANLLVIEHNGVYSNSATDTTVNGCLLQDATVNAIASARSGRATASLGVAFLRLFWVMLAGTTSSTTFKVRAGSASAGSTTFNGVSAGRLYGGTMASLMQVTEIMA